MATIILGAGVIGVTLAYYLAKKGEKVIVIERQNSVALETSFANAGQISPGYASPWAAPGVPQKAIGWLLQSHAPLAIKPDGTLFQWQWMIDMIKNCNISAYEKNKERMLRLAEYSRDCMKKLRQTEQIDYEGRQLGTLQLFRKHEQMEAVVQKDIPSLKAMNIEHQLLEGQALCQAEPALKDVLHKVVGGLRLPNDETGDCLMFTQKLAKICESMGVEFKFNQSVQKIEVQNQKVKAVHTHQGILTADHIVVALGSYSRELLMDYFKLPVYPVKGYSLTAQIDDPNRAPQSTILDESYKIALTRFANRIRVGGMAHVMGFNLEPVAGKQATLEFVLNDLFSGGFQKSSIEHWCGLRPMTPDGTPIIGQTPIKGLWTSTGHGTLGWTMAAGSGELLADLITETQPQIKYSDLSMLRY
jgi:D-amino-acid dehydrogenase